MSGFVGDSGDAWGLCRLSPGWTLMDKALTPLGTRDRRLAGRQANTEKCPCCPRSLRRHRSPFASRPPMRLYDIDIERLRSRIPGTVEAKSSPTVPNLGSDGCRRRKPSRMPRRTWAVGAQQSHAPAVKRRRATLRSPHAAPSCIAPPSVRVGPRSREAGRVRQLLTDHAVVIGIPHERVGRMIPAHRRNAVPPRLLTRDPAVFVVVVAGKRVPTAHGAPSSSARRFR